MYPFYLENITPTVIVWWWRYSSSWERKMTQVWWRVSLMTDSARSAPLILEEWVEWLTATLKCLCSWSRLMRMNEIHAKRRCSDATEHLFFVILRLTSCIFLFLRFSFSFPHSMDKCRAPRLMSSARQRGITRAVVGYVTLTEWDERLDSFEQRCRGKSDQ